jgi:hypothetical protein
MLDYIYEDYLYYIFETGLFIYILIVVIFICVIYMAVCGNNKFATGFIIFSILAFLFVTNYPRQVTIGSGSHYDCNRKLEQEASNIAWALADYFSIPTRTQIPKYSDLDFSGENSTILENMDSNRRAKLVKESEFSVKILGDVSEILIVLSCKKGKCPFYRWKCPRRDQGKIYVRRMGGSGANEWLNSYDDI